MTSNKSIKTKKYYVLSTIILPNEFSKYKVY